MNVEMEQEYWVPEHVQEYLRSLGSVLPLESMEGYIRSWHDWMTASGSFYDYRDTDGFGRIYEVHRHSIHPAMRVCKEWGSLLLNDKTAVVCDGQECTDFLSGYFTSTNFIPMAQATVVRLSAWARAHGRSGSTSTRKRLRSGATTRGWSSRSRGARRA